MAVNSELLLFYWGLGADIIARQHTQPWGSKLIDRLSRDLTHEFPDMQGFSVRNLKYIRQWHEFWSAPTIGQQVVAQLTSIPWGHNLALISKCQFYLAYPKGATLSHLLGWSHVVELLKLDDPLERSFYEQQCARSRGTAPPVGKSSAAGRRAKSTREPIIMSTTTPQSGTYAALVPPREPQRHSVQRAMQ